MAITDLYTVKLVGELYEIIGTGAPTTSTVGTLGDRYVDTATGLTYECTDDADPYVWEADTSQDASINLYITKAENDYLRIRGKGFTLDDDDNIIYPDGSTLTAAEMVCYLLGYGEFQGRGNKSDNIGGRSTSYLDKIMGYPPEIVGAINRFYTA